MSYLNEYIEFCREADTTQNFTQLTYDYLEQTKVEVTLLSHTLKIKPLEILKSNTDKTIEMWCENFNKITLSPLKLTTHSDEYKFFFSSLDFYSGTIYIFVIKTPDNHSSEILEHWQASFLVQQNIQMFTKKEAENTYANLISQLLHDVHSLMENTKSREEETLQRINYQKKLNKNLLFYIREFDVFKTDIGVENFISDSLSLMDLNSDAFKLNIENPELKIHVDVELFSNTFNAIVKNAMETTNGNISKIEIKTYSLPSGSPFLKHNWIVIEISDKGNGISEDFIPFVTKPFFTTNKHNGNTGFGLSNAEKIISAHNGFMEINSGEGTTVKIYIPQTSNEK